jgi:hypothetical protein
MNNIGELIPFFGMLTGIVIPLGILYWLYRENKKKNETIIEISKNLGKELTHAV